MPRPLPLAGEIPLYEGDLDADLKLVSRNRLAEQLFPISHPSKMDSPSWGISAARCRIGSLLGKVEGSLCHPDTCYAKRGTFRFPNVQTKLEQAYQGLMTPLWTPAAIQQILWYGHERFRWMMSGDLQGIPHLRNIIRICLETPLVLHWLPTREKDAVLACKDEIPPNLFIRASATRADSPPPSWWPLTSTVVTDEADATCPSSLRGGNCAENECTACWSHQANIAYLKH